MENPDVLPCAKTKKTKSSKIKNVAQVTLAQPARELSLPEKLASKNLDPFMKLIEIALDPATSKEMVVNICQDLLPYLVAKKKKQDNPKQDQLADRAAELLKLTDAELVAATRQRLKQAMDST